MSTKLFYDKEQGVIIVKRIVLPAATLIVLVTAAQAQQNLQIGYNKLTDQTTVRTQKQLLTGVTLDGLHLVIVGMHGGKEFNTATNLGILIFSVADEPQFKGDRGLSFAINRELLRLGQMVIGFEEDDSIRYMEALYLGVSQEVLRKLADGKKVRGKVGSKEFELKKVHQEAIKTFLQYFAKKPDN
jgi:hypothetical protein